jgi:hypothetical protein
MAQLLRCDCCHNGLQGGSTVSWLSAVVCGPSRAGHALHTCLAPYIFISIYSRLRYCSQLGLHSFRQSHLIEDPEAVQDIFVTVGGR